MKLKHRLYCFAIGRYQSSGAGTYTLTAKATDNLGGSKTSTARTITIAAAPTNVPPTVNITTPANNTSFTAPANIALTATATDSDGSISQVAFYDGATLLGTATQQGVTSTYIYNWNNVGTGSYTNITAKATDNSGNAASNSSTSAAIQLTVTAAVAQIYYIHTDQLNTPRLITNQANAKVWEWNNDDPFANNVPNDDPNATGNHFTFNQRLPGQYFDQETNTYYNYYRDYDPATGRYTQSDPIGLEGGINTYGYVGGNPLSYSDPRGLLAWFVIPGVCAGGGCEAAGAALVLATQPGQKAVRDAASSAADGISWAVDKVIELCTPKDDDPCDELLKQDEAACAVPGIRYGKRGLAICMQSAMQRYGECLKSGPGGVKTPLHGVDTPL